MTCYGENDGALVGKHRVEVVAMERIDPTTIRWNAPKKYANFRTSGLEVELPDSTEDITVDLTWDGGKPFTERTEPAPMNE